MAFYTRKKFSAVAVSAALSLGEAPNRVMGVEVFFPDIGFPVAVSLGYLRFRGEPAPTDGSAVTTEVLSTFAP